MITLKTGLPRNGKTLSLVTELAALIERWEKHPEERRPVYQYGIPELTLEGVQPLPVYPAAGEKGDAVPLTVDGKPAVPLTFDQGDIPDGSLICIDECQDFYPPRGPSQQAPQHVKALNTHGHRNIDYIVLTQHPKLIDNSVRRLVNKHQHYRRLAGQNFAILYEWDACSDTLTFNTAVKGQFRYPSKTFGKYKSASGFTKPSFRLPMFLIIPALAVPLAIWQGPTAYRAITGHVAPPPSERTAAAPAAPTAAASAPAPGTTGAVGGGGPGRPQGRPQKDWKRVSGCYALADDCRCFDDRGITVLVPVDVCRVSSRGFDGIVKWEPREYPQPQPARVEASSRPASAPVGVDRAL